MNVLRQLGLSTAFAVVAAAPEAHGDPLLLSEQPGHTTESVVTIDASPSEIYALVTDYGNWRTVFSDVRSVKVVAGGARDGTVRFRSHALEHEVTVRFDNIPDRLIRFKGIHGPPGGRASGTYELTPVAEGAQTVITARLYMNVVGLPSLFVGDSTIRAMRQAKLRADLIDLIRRFPPRPAQVSR